MGFGPRTADLEPGVLESGVWTLESGAWSLESEPEVWNLDSLAEIP